MSIVKIDYTNVLKFVSKEKIDEHQKDALSALDKLIHKSGEGNDFVGWIDWPVLISPGEIQDIRETADMINEQSECLLVIGIGGSYLGAKAVISMLDNYYPAKKGLEIIFAGHTLSSTYTAELLEYLQHRSFSINVISKSGTTTEPAIAFRLAKELLEKKYGDEASKRIFVTTTADNSVLHSIAKASGYKEFFIPKDIGGRYSVLTSVGLLPIACAGYDIYEILKGAMDARQIYSNAPFWENDALLYATIRNILYKNGKDIELLVSHEPKLKYFAEWWKQLYGESEGKEHKGLFPASVIYSTDLHSLGQYVQDGQRKLFETVINIVKPEKNLLLNKDINNYDGLNFIADKSLDYIAKKAMEGTIQAHVEGDVPNILIHLEKIDQHDIGFLLYFFMFACGISGYLLGVNPFNQEGVEAYKKKMFELLGKPGY
ncbi:MAG: glucose-6-phosphate isomerase [Bacilli bacterium]|jgi:glucose-6-phosphate isomerase|nr:glucose-6-phosphate isomerase [Bacilli bacterium]MDD3348129.1 glucose-6-phosphate isomerase [Bacilli bacterium]MDD4056076.1 glucose-6-phosphate isomerase [Bacilli bacterium]MDY0208776.1 glucose-6-phosphate isomerase [Bacilli bacterium]